MPRTAVLNKEQIIEAAFTIASKTGRETVTIRSIAKVLGTSTAPIYTQYSKIETIFHDLSVYVKSRLMESTGTKRTPDPFLNIGVGILAFALENKLIFTHFFLNEKESIFDFKSREESFLTQMKENQFLALLGDERLQSLLEDMWIYTYGLATMICTGLESETDLAYYQNKLMQTGNKLINYHLYSTGKFEEYIKAIHDKISEHINIEEVYKL